MKTPVKILYYKEFKCTSIQGITFCAEGIRTFSLFFFLNLRDSEDKRVFVAIVANIYYVLHMCQALHYVLLHKFI